jgi:hypothetical protein
MTTLKTPMPRYRWRTAGMLGGSLIVALLAAGCAGPAAVAPAASVPPAATATPTPTPTAVAGEVEAPQSEEEAIDGATAARQAYLDIRSEIEIEHPADSSAIDSVAIGEVAEDMHRIAAELDEDGKITAGSYSYEVTGAYAGDLTASDGTVYPFSNAQLEGCFSTEGISATNADGSPAAMNSNRTGVVKVSVFYVSAQAKWFVAELANAGTENVPC